MSFRQSCAVLAVTLLAPQAYAKTVTASGVFDRVLFDNSTGVLQQTALRIGDSGSVVAVFDENVAPIDLGTTQGVYPLTSLQVTLAGTSYAAESPMLFLGIGPTFSLVLIRGTIMINGNSFFAGFAITEANGFLQDLSFPATLRLADLAKGSVFVGGGVAGNAGVFATLDSLVWPTADGLVNDLLSLILGLRVPAGISNAFTSKLNNVLKNLGDGNESNDGAALNNMYAFCNSVSAQRGRKLTGAQADEVLAAANQVIRTLDGSAAFCQ